MPILVNSDSHYRIKSFARFFIQNVTIRILIGRLLLHSFVFLYIIDLRIHVPKAFGLISLIGYAYPLYVMNYKHKTVYERKANCLNFRLSALCRNTYWLGLDIVKKAFPLFQLKELKGERVIHFARISTYKRFSTMEIVMGLFVFKLILCCNARFNKGGRKIDFTF